MRTTQQQSSLKLVYAIGIPMVTVIGGLFVSTVYLIGLYLYSTYLEPKPTILEPVKQTQPKLIPQPAIRGELEEKYRKYLRLSGFKDNVNLKSLTDEQLIAENQKLEKALREAS